MKTVPLYGKKANGRFVEVDDDDYVLVSQHRWFIQQGKRGEASPPLFYAKTKTAAGRHLYMHRLIAGFAEVDHRDGDGLNNRRSNLRDATHAQNAGNARKQPGRTSQFKGVCWARRSGKWRASIGVNHRSRYLGEYSEEEAAARAYDVAAREAWGEFARLNFPD
jgi:hypothetical protein